MEKSVLLKNLVTVSTVSMRQLQKTTFTKFFSKILFQRRTLMLISVYLAIL